MGQIIGSIIGTVFIGGLFGWIIHKVFRLPYPTSDGLGLLLVTVVASFTNATESQSTATTWLLYSVASVLAYFILRRVRRQATQNPRVPVIEPVMREPFAHSEPNDVHQSPMAADIQLEEEIAFAVRSQYQGHSAPPARRKASNLIARHWRGELSLPVSYWLISFAANVCGIIIVTALTATFTPGDGYEPAAILALLSATWSVLTLILVWQIVGLWRSAERRADELFSLRKGAFWARAAQFMAVIGVLQFGASFVNTGAPQFAELSRIVFQNDPDIPNATLRISDNARLIVLTGGIKYGLAGHLETLLNAGPNIDGILLSSPGGRVAEAKKVFDLVRNRGLNTFVVDECSSACTLIFVAGRNRLVGQYGRLGFHGSYFPGMTAQDLRDANDEWASLYRAAGLSADFLDRALQVPPEGIWYPTTEELRQAGVTAGSASEVAGLPDGFTPQASSASVRESLMAASSIYEAIDTYAPDRAAEIYALGLDYAEGRVPADVLTRKINGIIAQIVSSRISGADDATLVEFAAVAADEYAALLQRDTTACFHYASGTGSVNLGDYVPEALAARGIALNERIIRSAGIATPVDQAYVDAIWANVASAMQVSVTTEQFSVFTKPAEQVTKGEHGSYCIAAIVMMQELSKLPMEQAAAAIRSLHP